MPLMHPPGYAPGHEGDILELSSEHKAYINYWLTSTHVPMNCMFKLEHWQYGQVLEHALCMHADTV